MEEEEEEEEEEEGGRAVALVAILRNGSERTRGRVVRGGMVASRLVWFVFEDDNPFAHSLLFTHDFTTT